MYPSVLSTCSKPHYEDCIANGGRLVEVLKLPQLPLATLIDRYDLRGKLDLISVDIEGFDKVIAGQLAALPDETLPKCVCIECFGDNAEEEIRALLQPKFANLHRSGPNLIFWN